MTAAPSIPVLAPETHPWYAVRVRSKFERLTSAALRGKGYEQFLPLVHTRRRWSDRIKELDLPLFPGYVFCRFDAVHRLPILESPGVAGIVGFGARPAPIPDSEIAAVQAMLRSSLRVEPWLGLAVGRRIRIDHGPLAGTEGVIVKVKKAFRLVASVTLLQRSVSVEIDREWVSPIAG